MVYNPEYAGLTSPLNLQYTAQDKYAETTTELSSSESSQSEASPHSLLEVKAWAAVTKKSQEKQKLWPHDQ